MSIIEGQQAEWSTRPQQKIPSGFAPTLATTTLSGCASKSLRPLSEQTHATTHEKLVYAVSNLTLAQESISDEMLLKSVAEGDKAAMHIFVRSSPRASVSVHPKDSLQSGNCG